MILLIDNFDSFTYNLYHFVAGSPALQQYAHQHRDMQQRCDMPQRCAEREGNGDSNGAGSATGVAGGKPAVQVVRNDAVTLNDIRRLHPQAIILSPGPGRPENSGICPTVMRELTGEYPILGVCLGHQALCQVFGATITYADELLHGKASLITVDPTDQLFQGLPERVVVGRYHSLVADPATMPDELRITARADDGEIMAVTHTEHPTYGVQFHPESILTPQGQTMIDNFLHRSLA